ncbi:carboxymuconolactone decarboxylase family protein [Flexivirga oryzae]|uniref:AhpD family alkylhydroperoxidase n=1 Tax=Flexivirga oryzae TaxID=1794944 RepID=A0A839NGJ3_9MICO|nr:carboxymuconolactone decarboxylase family protein [Flexivirga oryzae]MBB2894716.1 AhpD family alkylhydroperoxidase [Flexivirga oryzae]
MTNPAGLLDESATKGILAVVNAVHGQGVPDETLELVHLRVSQINGCSWCLNYGMRSARKAGESDERLMTLAGWRDAPYFTDDERAALLLAEHMTRIADSLDPVPDAVWDEVADRYDEKALAALVLWISTTNLFNRINVTTRQVAGTGMA